MTKIYAVAISGIVIIVAFLALTSIGHVIDAATQHFMLYYAGVFALIALCASVGLGLVATDRMILNPGHRILVQSAHRAASFGALAFLVIHIVTEILAQRVHVLDAFVPFLSPFRTFYIGLGTISSDLVLLLVITGIFRKRFTAHGNAWKWRAIHYASYVAFVFGVWHGLLGGRPGKPYVDWSYGFVVAFVAIGLAVRILANSLRPKENLSAPPVPDAPSPGTGPMRAASMFAQLGMARAASQNALNAQSAPQPMLSAAPVGDWNSRAGTGPRAAMAALPAGPEQYDGPGRYDGPDQHDGQQPFYEPGYEGPPRYLGAPRTGNTGPYPTTGPTRAATGAHPQVTAGTMPPAPTDPQMRAATGPMPRATGPATGSRTGPMPRATGPTPRYASGPQPRPATGPQPRPATGPQPRGATGAMPRPATGPRPGMGPQPRQGTGPHPRPATGPMPQAMGPGTGPRTGAQPRGATGPVPRSGRPRGGAPSGGRDGAPPRTRPRGDDPRGGGRGAQGQPRRGAPGRARNDDTASDWNYDLPPWDGGSPEPDQTFRYREPGPGMPGYRGTRDPYRRGGDDQR